MGIHNNLQFYGALCDDSNEYIQLNHVARKPVFAVSDLVLHKTGCTTTALNFRFRK